MADYMELTIERRHRDGHWEAVFSSYRFAETYGSDDIETSASEAATELVFCKSRVHGVVSNVGPEATGGAIATSGLPGDASAYTQNFLAGDPAVLQQYKVLKPKMFHSPGVLSEDQLLDGSKKGGRVGQVCWQMLRWLEQIEPLLGVEILWGNVRFRGSRITHLDMANASNHERLVSQAKIAELEPISPTTLRMCLAYHP